LFDDAGYEPVPVVGEHRDNVIAFIRRLGDRAVMCVVPRLTASLERDSGFPIGHGVWRDTALSTDGVWVDRLSCRTTEAADGALAVGGVLELLPVAVLERR
jgi:(1->4)-alpha-D-glucan 1-alpha-D-glucosylmutase